MTTNGPRVSVGMCAGLRLVSIGLLSTVLVLGVAPTVVAQEFTIDGFDFFQVHPLLTNPGPPAQQFSTGDDASIFGTERDIESEITAGGIGTSLNVLFLTTPNRISVSLDATVDGIVTLVWDGNDGDATTVDAATGLGGENLMVRGADSFDRFRFEIVSTDLGFNFSIRVWSSPTSASESTLAIAGPGTADFLFSGFAQSGEAGVTSAANFASVNAIELIIDPPIAGDLELDEFKLGSTPTDFGDAPATFPVTLAGTGANHLLGSTVYLGACVDSEGDGQASAAADGDDLNVGAPVFGTCSVAGDDEDGVQIISLPIGPSELEFVSITGGPGCAGSACLLNAWVDFNGNGSWADAGEQVFTDAAITQGGNFLNFTAPAAPGVTSGSIATRWRVSTAGGDGITGQAADGEVEDYVLASVPVELMSFQVE